MIKRNDGISEDDICQNQFTAYVLLAVKRKRQSYIKKKQREHEKENRTKKEAEQSEFRTAGYDMWSRMEPQNEKLMAAMQQLSLKERFVVTEYVLKGKPFKEIAQETGLKEKGVASWCCTIKVDIENSKGQYIEKDKQEATKDGSKSTKIQHGI